jgi:hypothetical protein
VNFFDKVIVEKCYFDTVILYFLQPPVSPFFKGESDDDLTYFPLSRGLRDFPLIKGNEKGLFLLAFLYFSTIMTSIYDRKEYRL